MSDAKINENILKPVSLRLLYDGMLVRDDIYDSTGDRLLLKAGGTLTFDQIDRIRRINSGSDTIFVTGRTHKTMLSKRPNIKIISRVEIEEATGYASMLAKSFELMQGVSNNKKLDTDAFTGLAVALSEFIKNTSPSVAISLLNMVAPADEYLPRHIINVAMLNGLIGLWLGLHHEQVDKLVLVGLLHDCGQALIPPGILLAPRKITRVEYEVVKMHVIHTKELLVDFSDDISLVASSHHERIDGSGYPDGLTGVAISTAVRITAASDIYDAMVSNRTYRTPYSPFHVLALFGSMSPKQLDSKVVRVLKDNIPQELAGKPVTMSDGTIGIVRGYDLSDIEYPTVEISSREIKTNPGLHPVSMYSDD